MVVPSLTPSTKTSTLLLASAVPASVGVVSLVVAFVSPTIPVMVGADGAVVSVTQVSLASPAKGSCAVSSMPEPSAVRVRT